MSSPKTPQQAVLTLTDPDHVKEVLVSQLQGTCVVGPNLHMTFSVVRPIHVASADGVTEIKLSSIVGLRPVIPLVAIPDMIEQLRQIMQGQALHQASVPPKAN